MHKEIVVTLNEVMTPDITNSLLEEAYKEMARDAEREKEVNEWIGGVCSDISYEKWLK